MVTEDTPTFPSSSMSICHKRIHPSQLKSSFLFFLLLTEEGSNFQSNIKLPLSVTTGPCQKD